NRESRSWRASDGDSDSNRDDNPRLSSLHSTSCSPFNHDTMTVLPTPEIYGYTIFCDDIRQEVGGKISFVGVYSDTIFIHGEFPVTLPKFAFVISLIQRREILERNIQVQIFLPGDDEDSPSISQQISEPVEGAAGQIAGAVDDPKDVERTATMQV